MSVQKISDEEVERLRKIWESDPRIGFQWLCREQALPVTHQALRKISIRRGWKKGGGDDPAHEAEQRRQAAKRAEEKRLMEESTKPARIVNAPQKKTKRKIPRGSSSAVREREERFLEAYVGENFNVTKACKRVHLSVKGAYAMLNRESVQNRLQEILGPKAEQLGIDAEALISIWAKTLLFDVNEVVQYRRHCCPFCYSEDDEPLQAKDEYYEKKEKYDYRRLFNDKLPEFPAYDKTKWWDRSLPPKEDCPNCHGNGYGEIWVADTRNLSPMARYMFLGVKEGKDGIEVMMMNKEKAADNLAKALGLFKDKDEAGKVGEVSAETLLNTYEERMRMARERSQAMRRERGLQEIVDVEVKEGNGG